MGMLSSIWKANKGIATVATLASGLFVPFALMAAGNAAAAGAIAVGAAKVTATAAATVATAATPATVLPSFWTGLFFDPLTGQSGIGAGLTNMFNGAVALGKSFGAVVGAVFDPSITVKEALKTPLSLSAPV